MSNRCAGQAGTYCCNCKYDKSAVFSRQCRPNTVQNYVCRHLKILFKTRNPRANYNIDRIFVESRRSLYCNSTDVGHFRKRAWVMGSFRNIFLLSPESSGIYCITVTFVWRASPPRSAGRRRCHCRYHKNVAFPDPFCNALGTEPNSVQ